MSKVTVECIRIDNCYILGEHGLESIKSIADENSVPVSSRCIAADILEEVESVLEKYDIDIPSGDKDDLNPNRARLYGMTYFTLLDKVEEIVANALETVSDNKNVDIIKGVLY